MINITQLLKKSIYLAGMFILLVRCGKDETIINNTIVEEAKIYVIGEIGPRYFYTNEVEVLIWVNNSYTIPEVLINDYPISIRGYTDLGVEYYKYDYDIEEGDSIKLVVSYAKQNGEEGIAGADLIYPGPFELIGYDEYATDTIYGRDDYSANWTPSEGKDWYIIDGYFSYLYRDALGHSRGVNIFLDTTILDTSIFIPTSIIFPDEADIMEIVTGGGYFSVYAVSGPVSPGENSNISGDGRGFVYARNQSRRVIFEILD